MVFHVCVAVRCVAVRSCIVVWGNVKVVFKFLVLWVIINLAVVYWCCVDRLFCVIGGIIVALKNFF